MHSRTLHQAYMGYGVRDTLFVLTLFQSCSTLRTLVQFLSTWYRREALFVLILSCGSIIAGGADPDSHRYRTRKTLFLVTLSRSSSGA